MTMTMLDRARAIEDEIIRLRREIHRFPELAFQEVRTAQLVADTLREAGEVLGWRPTMPLADGIAATAAWFADRA